MHTKVFRPKKDKVSDLGYYTARKSVIYTCSMEDNIKIDITETNFEDRR